MVSGDLAGGMAVANMPGNTWQIVMPHRQQRLRRRLNKYDAPIIKAKPFPMIYRSCLGKLNQKRLTFVADQPLAPQEPRLIIQRYRIKRSDVRIGASMSLRLNFLDRKSVV